jgi:hypothetical protein
VVQVMAPVACPVGEERIGISNIDKDAISVDVLGILEEKPHSLSNQGLCDVKISW